jgi:Flp pilus assembly protein TadB
LRELTALCIGLCRQHADRRGDVLSWQIAELNERRTQIEDLLKRAGSLDEEKPQLQHQLARSGELRDSMLQQQAEAGKSQRDKLMIVAAFLLAIVFALGVWAGHSIGH